MTTQRIAKNMGKVEFLANLDEIRQMLAQGYNYKNVYSKMAEEGRFTMSYFTFCHHLRQMNSATAKREKVAEPSTGNTSSRRDGFVKPTDIKVSDLI